MTKLKNRFSDQRIETLRGLAICGVVAHHASLWMIRGISSSNVDPGSVSHFLLFLSEFFSPLRMPLFTVISGWVYALMPVNKSNIKPFFLAKVRRIILPLFFVSTVMYFMSGVVNNEYPGIVGQNPQAVLPHQFCKMWFYHFGHLWFLQALILLFVLVAIIDRCGAMDNVKKWLFWLSAAALAYYVFPNHIEFWSLSKVREIMPFFIFGVGLYRFREQIFSSKFIKFTGPVLAGSLLVQYFGWPWLLAKNDWVLALFIGTLAPIFLLSLNFTFKPLMWIGKYSYTIYLYHGIPWILLTAIGVELIANDFQWAWAVIFLTSGLLSPIIIETIGVKIPFLRTPLLGKKP